MLMPVHTGHAPWCFRGACWGRCCASADNVSSDWQRVQCANTGLQVLDALRSMSPMLIPIFSVLYKASSFPIEPPLHKKNKNSLL